MAELVDTFGGKVSGELIRASDWNGLIAAIEAQLAALETRLGDRLDALETRVGAAEARHRHRRGRARARCRASPPPCARASARSTSAPRAPPSPSASSARSSPASPTSRARRSTSPTRRRGPGSISSPSGARSAPRRASSAVGGASNRTVTVQVNAEGEARVLLRAEHAEAFAEEQELEVAAVLQTTVGTATVAESILTANTPGSTGRRAGLHRRVGGL